MTVVRIGGTGGGSRTSQLVIKLKAQVATPPPEPKAKPVEKPDDETVSDSEPPADAAAKQPEEPTKRTAQSSAPSLPWAEEIQAEVDPAVVTDATLRDAIKATGLPWRVRDKGTNIEMLLVPPGEFVMGESLGDDDAKDELPAHEVKLTKAFYLGRYEVTQAQWQASMGSNPSRFQSASAEVPLDQVPQRPVEQVSWNTIQGFLSQTGMRLPTEAEWEYAYRAGTTTAFHGYTGRLGGMNDDRPGHVGQIAWISSNSNYQTRPVGGKLGNGYGLHDMAGNVREWVNDWYGNYSAGAHTNPQGPSWGWYRVLRGGSWNFNSFYCPASYRNPRAPDDSKYYVGFRVARTP